MMMRGVLDRRAPAVPPAAAGLARRRPAAAAPRPPPRCGRRRPAPVAAAAAAATAAAPAALFAAGWPLWAALAGVGAATAGAARSRVGAALSAPLLATLIALAAAAFGFIPAASPVYSAIWYWVLPLAMALYLLECDVSRLLSSSTTATSLLAFANGALATVVGTGAAFVVAGGGLGAEGPAVAAALCASYIGGSVNFAAVAAATALPTAAVAAAMAADNVAMALYIGALGFLSPSAERVSAEVRGAPAAPAADAAAAAPPTPTVETLALALGAAAAACALGAAAAARWFPAGALAFTALFASAAAAAGAAAARRLAPAFPAAPFAGAEALGGALMLLFFATIGASAGGLRALAGAGGLFAFISIQLSVQLAVTLALGRAMRLELPVILVAANANVGGPATAAAMAAAKGWRGLVQPAMLTGSVGYAVGNAVGLAAFAALRRMPAFMVL